MSRKIALWDLLTFTQKVRQNAAENSDSEENSENTAAENSDFEGNIEIPSAASSTQRNCQITAENVENESDQPKAKKLKTHSEIEIHEIYHPPSTFKFPLRKIGGQNRSCQHIWLEKFQWLHYSLEKDSLFCYPCNRGQRSIAKISLMKERYSNSSLFFKFVF